MQESVIRAADWAITTPLLLLDILLLAGLSIGDTLWILFADIAMIVTGLFGALLPNRYKWGGSPSAERKGTASCMAVRGCCGVAAGSADGPLPCIWQLSVGVAQQRHRSRAATGRAGTGTPAALKLCNHAKQGGQRRGTSWHAGWFGLGCVFMLVIIYGLLFHARRAAMLRSKKVRGEARRMTRRLALAGLLCAGRFMACCRLRRGYCCQPVALLSS